MIRFLLIFSFVFLSNVQVYAQKQTVRVLFFGDSITAGYGLEKSQAFPALIQEKTDSLKWNVEIINGGLSGETSAGGLRRIDWMLQNPIDIFVLELGANDGLRGVSTQETSQNLKKIIDKVRAKNPNVTIILAGMQVPPNLGEDYTKVFASIFSDVAKEKKTILIPFILEKVAGNPKLNLADGIHPTAIGHTLVMQTVWEYVGPEIKKRVGK